MRIYKQFTFEAAHFLPSAPAGHPNSRIHGHSFRVVVWLDGSPNAETGLIKEFGDLKNELDVVRERLDHRMLNEVPGLPAPTLECISQWIWEQLQPRLPNLARVEIHRDSCGEGCVYDGPEA